MMVSKQLAVQVVTLSPAASTERIYATCSTELSDDFVLSVGRCASGAAVPYRLASTALLNY